MHEYGYPGGSAVYAIPQRISQFCKISYQKLKIIFLGLRQFLKNTPRKAPPIPIITDSNSKCKFI
jgi:hypothetical protein